jgi:histidinol-phosphate phosphatase family protein
MKEQGFLKKVDSSWTLFLDRDGVINKKRDNDYVKKLEEFILLPDALEAIKYFNSIFGRVVVVTNQQGIGKGIMTHEDLYVVHDYLSSELTKVGAKIDAYYYAPQLASEKSEMRKPLPGMAYEAKKQFPEIDFSKSIMVGDSISDLEMGESVGMKLVYVHPWDERVNCLRVESLKELMNLLR